MPKLSKAKIERLRRETLPLLQQARRQWEWLRWCLPATMVALALGADLGISHYMARESHNAWLNAVLAPVFVGLSSKFWGQMGKLNRVGLAIQLGTFDTLVQSIQDLDFTFGKTSKLVEHVERIIAQPD